MEVLRFAGGKIPVAVLGATGTVGQRFLALLDDHPWFEVVALTASPRSVGKPYAEAVPWIQPGPIPEAVASLVLRATEPEAVTSCRLVFSALGSEVASEVEPAFAAAGFLVVSNASSFRMHEAVPLVVPELNPDHLDLIAQQRFGPGAILTNPNCSTIGLVMALGPLADAFGLEKVHAVTLQAVSGAGLPGVSSYQILDNLIPYIATEEEKIEQETCKILGRLRADRTAIEPYAVAVSAACNRVPVIDGHTICASVALGRSASAVEVRQAWEAFRGEPQKRRLPSAPPCPILYLDGPDVPQPRLHRELGAGMAAVIGRLRHCPLLDFKFVVLSHNTVRGAAGGALLLAELAVARGLIAGAELN